ncbi:hypothetical protein F0562_032430 [Nyssa sinensis]|uniref:Uncharacterized protein n=1 Tax=Nyssa sinensis TaxID=561372 RepID=A0A5J5ATU1_9ASTE|nr:hypothetical protein F0562_032430 [Nyssa sinensis]
MLHSSTQSTRSGPDFHLLDEILSVIPIDSYDQLDLARKIMSMAIASCVSKLEPKTGDRGRGANRAAMGLGSAMADKTIVNGVASKAIDQSGDYAPITGEPVLHPLFSLIIGDETASDNRSVCFLPSDRNCVFFNRLYASLPTAAPPPSSRSMVASSSSSIFSGFEAGSPDLRFPG